MSYTEVSDNPWTENTSQSNAVFISSNVFVIAFQNDCISEYENNSIDGLYQCNVIMDEWELFMKFSDDFKDVTIKHLCVDAQNDELYLCASYRLIILNIKTKQYKIYKHKYVFYNAALVINSKFHLIGYEYKMNKFSYTMYHFLWNKQTATLDKLYEFGELKRVYVQLIHNKFQNIMYMFGDWRQYINTPIYSYDLNHLHPKWIKRTDIILPFAGINNRFFFERFSCVLSNDERYLFLIGDRKICVFQFETAKFDFLKVDAPNMYGNKIAVSGPNTKMLLVFGYLRQLHTINIMELPNDVIQLIGTWVQDRNWIYFLSQSSQTRKILKQVLIDSVI